MQIRCLSSANAAALQELRSLVDAGAGGTLGSQEERELALEKDQIEKSLQAPDQTFGAFINGILVGVARLSPMLRVPFEPDTFDAHGISDVIVRPYAQGKGIGRELLNKCLLRAAELSAAEVHLVVNTPNPSAEALYKSLGFEVLEETRNTHQHNDQQFSQIAMLRRMNKV